MGFVMMGKSWIFYICYLLIFALSVNSQVGLSSNPPVIKVGYIQAEPFVETENTILEGFAIDLWVYISRNMNNQPYQFINAGNNYNAALKKLYNGDFDVLIGNISISSSRMHATNFTIPYLLNNTALVVLDKDKDQGIGFIGYLKSIITGKFGIYFLVIFLMIFVISFLHWLSQRHDGKKSDASTGERVEFSFWISLYAILVSKPAHSSSSTNFLSRVVVFLGCCVGMVFVGLISAAFTTSLINSEDEVGGFDTIDTFQNKKILVQAGSIQNNYVRKIGATPVEITNLKEGFQMLENYPDIYSGFAVDYSLAKRSLEKFKFNDLVISPYFIGSDLLAFSVPYASPYLKNINIAIARAAQTGVINHLCDRYITTDRQQCKLLTLYG